MEENTTAPLSTTPSELDTNFDDIDLSYPRLSKGSYELLIKEAKRTSTDENDYIKLSLETTTDATTTDGKSHPAGFKTSTTLWLKTNEFNDEDRINKTLAATVRAAGLTGMTKASFLANPAVLNGKVAPCRVGVYKSKKTGEEGNSFDFFIKK